MKKSVSKIFTVLALTVMFSATAIAQNYQEIRALGLFPIGSYGRVGATEEMYKDQIIGSGAAIGAGLGYRYSFDLSMGVTFIVGGDVLWNMTNADYRRICSENNSEAAPMYFNVPLSVGVGLNYQLGRSPWSVFFDATAGLNIHYTTSTGWKNFEVQYKPVLSPALSAEVAMRCRNFSFGFLLLSLGSPTMKIASGEERFQVFHVDEQKRSMLMGNIVLSYRLAKTKKEWRPSRKTILDS